MAPGFIKEMARRKKAELCLYFLAWLESRAERERLAQLPPSPEVDRAYRRAMADEDYDKCNYLRLKADYLAGGPDEA